VFLSIIIQPSRTQIIGRRQSGVRANPYSWPALGSRNGTGTRMPIHSTTSSSSGVIRITGACLRSLPRSRNLACSYRGTRERQAMIER
jgi:hypothetical protein